MSGRCNGGDLDRVEELTLKDPGLVRRMKSLCPTSLRGHPEHLALGSKNLVTRQMDFDFIGSRYRAANTREASSLASESIISLLYGWSRRYQRLGTFFEGKEGLNLVTLTALLDIRQKLGQGRHCDRFREFIDRAQGEICKRLDILDVAPEGLQGLSGVSGKVAGLLPLLELHNDALTLAAGIMDSGSDNPERALSVVDNASLPILMLALGEIGRMQRDRLAGNILLVLRDRLFDAEKGGFRNCRINKGELLVQSTYCTHPFLLIGLVAIAGRIEMPHAGSDLSAPIPEHIRSAWARAPLLYRPMRTSQAEILACFSRGDEIALLRQDNIWVSSFSLLSWLVHYHTIEPLLESYGGGASIDFMAVEELFFALLEEMAHAAATAMIRVAPWPWGMRYAMTIRHDVDRIPDPAVFKRLTGFHTHNKLAVSWYWLPWRLDTQQMQWQMEAGHEIGLHSVRARDKNREIAMLEAPMGGLSRVEGETFHGTAADFWIGYPSVRLAAEAGLGHTELALNMLQFPYASFPWMDSNGEIRLLQGPVGITYNASTDVDKGQIRKSARIGDIGYVREWAARGLAITLLNHPDINFARLVEYVEALPEGGRLNWTAGKVAKWWRSTHCLDRLRITGRDGKFQIAAQDDLEGLTLEFFLPPGRQTGPPMLDGTPAGQDAWKLDPDGMLRLRLNLRAGHRRTVQLCD